MKYTKLWTTVFMFVFIVTSGCASNTTFNNVSPPTPQITTAPSPKPSLTAMDLEPLLIQTGDLPPGFNPSQITDTMDGVKSKWPVLFNESFPQPDVVILQSIEQNQEIAGSVYVLYYSLNSSQKAAYETMKSRVIAYSENTSPFEKLDPGIGDQSIAYGYKRTLGNANFDNSSVLFSKCGGVVLTSISTYRVEQAVSYAKRLERRLEPLLCR